MPYSDGKLKIGKRIPAFLAHISNLQQKAGVTLNATPAFINPMFYLEIRIMSIKFRLQQPYSCCRRPRYHWSAASKSSPTCRYVPFHKPKHQTKHSAYCGRDPTSAGIHRLADTWCFRGPFFIIMDANRCDSALHRCVFCNRAGCKYIGRFAGNVIFKTFARYAAACDLRGHGSVQQVGKRRANCKAAFCTDRNLAARCSSRYWRAQLLPARLYHLCGSRRRYCLPTTFLAAHRSAGKNRFSAVQ